MYCVSTCNAGEKKFLFFLFSWCYESWNIFFRQQGISARWRIKHCIWLLGNALSMSKNFMFCVIEWKNIIFCQLRKSYYDFRRIGISFKFKIKFGINGSKSEFVIAFLFERSSLFSRGKKQKNVTNARVVVAVVMPKKNHRFKLLLMFITF